MKRLTGPQGVILVLIFDPCLLNTSRRILFDSLGGYFRQRSV